MSAGKRKIGVSVEAPLGDDLEFEELWREIRARNGARSDEDDAALLGELKHRAEMGEFPLNGRWQMVSPVDDPEPDGDETLRALTNAPDRNSKPLFAGLILMLIGAAIVLFNVMGAGSSEERVRAESATATAQALMGQPVFMQTAASAATLTAEALAPPQWGGASIEIGAGGDRQLLPAVYPETLEIDGTPFRVYPTAIEGGRWSYKELDGVAAWVVGTLINWSFGLPATEANLRLIRKLEAAGTEDKLALLYMSSGEVRRFRLQEPVQVERQQIQVFSQQEPGLTVVLLGDKQGARRWLLKGVSNSSAPTPNAGNP